MGADVTYNRSSELTKIGDQSPVPWQRAGQRPPREVIKQSSEWAMALMAVVNERGLYQPIGEAKYLDVEAWQIVGAFDGTSASTEWVHPVIDSDQDIVAYEASVVLMRAGEQVGRAIMECHLEANPCKGKVGRDKHKAAQSAAQTWAESKAYRMLYGFVARIAGYQPTPADEMTDTAPADPDDWAKVCPTHGIEWFKSGKMKTWAHKVDGSDKWCNRPTLFQEIAKDALAALGKTAEEEKKWLAAFVTNPTASQVEALKRLQSTVLQTTDAIGEYRVDSDTGEVLSTEEN